MNNYNTKTKENQTNSTEKLIDCVKELLGIKDPNIWIGYTRVDKNIKE